MFTLLFALVILALYSCRNKSTTVAEQSAEVKTSETKESQRNDRELPDLANLYKKRVENPDAFMTYTIPAGWSKVTEDETHQFPEGVTYKSSGFTFGDVGIGTGAYINVTGYKYPASLFDFVLDILPMHADSIIEMKSPVVYGDKYWYGDYYWINLHSCFEGCADSYYTKQGDYVWVVTMRCERETCKAMKEEPNSGWLVADRDTFLSSLKFSDD
ncbi:MAG: hypothetical protein GY861_04380 [bacterium]|nr:hypothetical protein [bacterium]